MKLLFDENLSPKLVANLGDVFPDSAHVRELKHYQRIQIVNPAEAVQLIR